MEIASPVHAAEPVRGYWSAEALRRAFENLGSNAVKYWQQRQADHLRSGPTIRTGLRPRPQPRIAHSIEEQETIFQAFRRTREAMASGKHGWGLGLALVRAWRKRTGEAWPWTVCPSAERRS